MDFRYKPAIRIISLIVLFFFCWTFGGMVDIVAFAATDSKQPAGSSKQLTGQSSSQTQPKIPKPDEKFQKTVESIEQILNDTSADTDTKKNKLKTKRSEIEGLDTAIKKQFSDTERFLKEKGLPPEILERHYKFVKHYEDNLKELNDNLVAIDKSRTKSEADAAISRAKAHLEKVKAPSKHVPLDPNKLPHRTAEPVWIEPRLNKEDFKEMQDARYKMQDKKYRASGIMDHGSVLVASNGSLNGLISEQQVITSPILLALADPPTSADLAETIEVKFTPAIQAKATELNHNPVKIYNWVRNNIEFVPTYGSIQGADYCLQTKQCNAIDTSSLLIALLRSSGIHARYVQGTIELPIEKVKNWVGGFTDSMEALRLLASAKIPTKGMTVGGTIEYARLEHVYVEAWIDYIPSRGARHKVGDTWIPLDASFKQYSYTQGIDIKSAVPFDAQSFVDQITSTATINEAEGYVTNVNSSYIQQQMTDYQTRVQNYISQNYPNATVGDVLGKKEIIKQEFPILAGTLPYRLILKGATYSSVPDSLRHKITFNVVKDMYDEIIGTPINITKSLPELAGKKITLSYSPATQADENVINSYLPKPHADGTPIQPNELPTSLPAYLINLKPELRVDGVVVATGTSVGMGNTEAFKMTFTAPNESPDLITNQIEAGEYLGIALDLGRISLKQTTSLKTKLEATKAKLEAQDFTNLTKDDILGDLLYATALSYYAELDVMDSVGAKIMGLVAIRLSSENIFSSELRVNSFFGIPISVSSDGLAMDVDRAMTLVKALDGSKEKPKQFFLSSGMNGSVLEHSVAEQLFSTPENPTLGISAVKALQIANDQGIPIYKINLSNINTVLPHLQVDANVKVDIQNAVNAGKEVTVSNNDITFNGWTGCGYIIIDPITGAGAYMISGGTNGAWLYIAIGNALILLGLITSEFGAGIALLVLGFLYVGIGLCILTESDVPLRVALAAINTIIFSVFVIIPGTGIFVASAILTLIWTILEGKAGEDIKKFCEGK
ncbi:MAG: transglutaminase-like domain-containing protein [Thermodesulfovibrionales bacterium]